jgi:pimeloyl-ACP methyl ester carboxylesterase
VPDRQRPPSRLYLLSEPGRATLEFGAMVACRPLLQRAPRGDGHPVLVLPGFLADDSSTLSLRRYLRGLGYYVHGWRLGRNLGPTPRIVDGLEQRLARVTDRHGQQASLVGWSLGGMFARELARRAPHQVRRVVTLGSPFRGALPLRTHATTRFEALSHLHVPDDELPPPSRDREPLAVPLTAVYSRSDGVVPWRSCLQPGGPGRENIEVVSSHCGLGHHPASLWAVADRVAEPAGRFTPFRPPTGWRSHYPRPG